MSRTIRRKNDKWEYKWVCHEWEWINEDTQYRQLIWIPITGIRKAQEIAEYHEDKPPGVRNCPAHFRRAKNKRTRSREKARTRRMLREGNFNNYYFNPRKRDANWDWW
jgi:hypothetical protein